MTGPTSMPGIWLLPLVVPALMVPAGFLIFFTEGRNVAQLLSIEAFACACPMSLWGLLGFVAWSARFRRS